jgi:hypothetical protein
MNRMWVDGTEFRWTRSCGHMTGSARWWCASRQHGCLLGGRVRRQAPRGPSETLARAVGSLGRTEESNEDIRHCNHLIRVSTPTKRRSGARPAVLTAPHSAHAGLTAFEMQGGPVWLIHLLCLVFSRGAAPSTLMACPRCRRTTGYEALAWQSDLP